MNINDYLIDQAGKDWPKFLRQWMPPLPPSFTLWLVNRFGDVFVVDDDGDGAVSMLEIGTGALQRVADNRDRFAQLIDADDNANNWLLIPLVDRCRSAGMELGPSQCYGFKIPPILGGRYDVANVEPTELQTHYAATADAFRKTMNLPAEVRAKFLAAANRIAN